MLVDQDSFPGRPAGLASANEGHQTALVGTPASTVRRLSDTKIIL